jgi:chemotaxis protein methyltransferase CheR
LAGHPWRPSPALAAKADPGILAAAPAARRATLLKQEPAPATYQQAFALYRQGRYAEATSETTKLLALQPNDTDAMTLMARIHANQGELAAALQWCEQTIAADRLNPVGHFLLAAILQEQGRMEEAMVLFKRTLYLDQDFVLAHFALGNLHLAQGNRRETRRHLNNALELVRKLPQDEILPEADGLSAGRLAEIITSVMASLPQPVHEITA